ncbi:MAG: RNA polymerase sigma factor [Chthonomonadales bacterium]|nr:RNA polymerase sigma factor [Chthonomonadales bacterium]
MQGLEASRAEGGIIRLTAGDNHLLDACRAGDRAALERLLTPHETTLYRLCLGILGRTEDAEDAVQEAFLRAIKGLPSFRGDASVKTWLQRIAVNVCLETRRKRRPVLPMVAAEEAPSGEGTIEASVLARMEALEALGTLTPQQRIAVWLKDVEGWSTREIADSLRWNAKKVENELYRARISLARWRTEARW